MLPWVSCWRAEAKRTAFAVRFFAERCQIFRAFYLNLDKYSRERGSIKSWLCVRASSRALDLARKLRRELLPLEENEGYGSGQEIFDACPAEELEGLLEGIDGARPDEVSLRRLERLTLKKAGLAPGKRRRLGRRWLRRAAAACLVLAVGGGAWAWAAEVKEYNEAVEFFIRNDLPTDGLTRSEIKAVYRDITTNSFTYEKTGALLDRGRVDTALAGMNITPVVPPATPEELQELWEARGTERPAFSYRLRWDYREDPELGFDVLDESALEHYEDGALIWSARFRFAANGFREISDGVLVWGCTYRWSSEQPSPAWLAKVSAAGEVLWQRELDHGHSFEQVACALEDPDGSLVTFVRGGVEQLLFLRWSPHGEVLRTETLAMSGPYGRLEATHFGEDYLVRLGSGTAETRQRIFKVDRDGAVTDEFRYSADDCLYFIDDMAEFGGKLYLSAHAVPRLPEEESAGGRDEIDGIMDDILSRWGEWSTGGMVGQVGETSVLEKMREHFTAVLLVCDPASGTPETFYTVRGAVGGALAVEDGRLLWDAEQFADAKFSPYTSAWSIWADCQVLRSAFDEAGTLVEQTRTDETTVFAR